MRKDFLTFPIQLPQTPAVVLLDHVLAGARARVGVGVWVGMRVEVRVVNLRGGWAVGRWGGAEAPRLFLSFVVVSRRMLVWGKRYVCELSGGVV